MSLAPEEPNVYSHGHQSDDPAPEERNVPAMSKSSNDISLLTELAEISQSSLFYKHSVPNGTVAWSRLSKQEPMDLCHRAEHGRF